jgi:hypothetical protein
MYLHLSSEYGHGTSSDEQLTAGELHVDTDSAQVHVPYAAVAPLSLPTRFLPWPQRPDFS